MGVLTTEAVNLPGVGGDRIHPDALKVMNTRLTSLGITPIVGPPAVGAVRGVFIGDGGGSVFNESPNAAVWAVRGVFPGPEIVWNQPSHGGDSDQGVWRPILLLSGDTALDINFISGVAPDLNLAFVWTDVELTPEMSVEQVTLNGTTWVKAYENTTPGTVMRPAPLAFGGEAALEPSELAQFFNRDSADHGIELAISPDNGVTLHTFSRDGGTWRQQLRVDSAEIPEGIANGESVWIRLNEGISTSQPTFRAILESIPELP